MTSELPSFSSDSDAYFGEEDILLSESHIPCLMEVLVEASHKWEELGIAIGLPRHVISQCKHDRHIVALNNILHEWVSGNYKGTIPSTFKNLKQKLACQIVGEGCVAHKLKIELLASQLPVSCPAKRQCVRPHSDTISFVAEHLRNFYSKQREVPRNTWPPVGTNTFINLVLIKQSGEIARDYDYSVRGDMDDIVKSKETVNYERMFSKYTEGGLILVEGRPGSGKTTLVHKIARDWASGGDILTNAKLVFLVPLRVLDHEIVGHTLSDLLKSIFWNKSDLESVCSKITEVNGKGVCFILDGLDEYKQRDSESDVHALLYKRFIPDAMVIVASRPVATAGLRRDCVITKHIEVIGFSKDQIYEYIERFPFVNSAKSEMSAKDKLKTYLKVHQNIQHMCYLPVHAAMVCFLHQYSECVPHTETKIYEEFTRLILLRCLLRSDENAQLPSLSSLCGQQAELFKKICHLAFDMTIQSKQVVHQRDTEVPLSPDCSHGDECGLGLVTIDHTVAMFGLTNTHTFLHLTLQEYLAAYHIASQDENEQVKVLREHGMKIHMNNVLVFYCGMIQFTEDDARLFVVDNSSYGIRCAFESRQHVVCDRVVKGEEGIFIHEGIFIREHLTLVDISRMVYVISYSSSHFKRLKITHCHINADKLKYFFECFSSCKHSMLRRSDMLCDPALLNYLDLSFNYFGVEGTMVLVSALNDANVHLRLLKLSKNNIGSEGARVVLDDLNCRQDIADLNLGYNYIEGAVWGGLKYWTNLKSLELSSNAIHVPSLIDGIVSTSQNCIRQPCIDLQVLDVSHCQMDSPETKALIDGLKLCTGLHELNLSGNNVGMEGVIELCDGLKCWHELKDLQMARVGIGGESAVVLAKGLQNCKALEMINIPNNSIGADGAIILANCLKYCSALRLMHIERNKIGSEGALALVEKLKSWPKLKKLYLGNNGIESETKTRLATFSVVKID